MYCDSMSCCCDLQVVVVLREWRMVERMKKMDDVDDWKRRTWPGSVWAVRMNDVDLNCDDCDG